MIVGEWWLGYRYVQHGGINVGIVTTTTIVIIIMRMIWRIWIVTSTTVRRRRMTIVRIVNMFVLLLLK